MGVRGVELASKGGDLKIEKVKRKKGSCMSKGICIIETAEGGAGVQHVESVDGARGEEEHGEGEKVRAGLALIETVAVSNNNLTLTTAAGGAGVQMGPKDGARVGRGQKLDSSGDGNSTARGGIEVQGGPDGGYVEEGVDETRRLREIAFASMGKGVKREARKLAQENGKEFPESKWDHGWARVTNSIINKEFESDSVGAAQPRPAQSKGAGRYKCQQPHSNV